MGSEEILGLLSILFAIFLLGILIKIEPISLVILLTIGGLIFFALYTKNNYAVFGVVVLIFSLLLYLFYSEEKTIIFSDYYISAITVFLIVIIGFLIGYKLLLT